MSAEPRIIAKFSDTAGLKDALRTRISELAISLDVVDEICNFPLRYASKLLAPSDMKNLGPMSFESLIGELGVELFMVENPITRERMLRRIEYATTGRPRKPVDLALGKRRHFIFKVSLRQLKKYAKMGGQARAR